MSTKNPEMGPKEQEGSYKTLSEGMIPPEGREEAKEAKERKEIDEDWEKFSKSNLGKILKRFGVGYGYDLIKRNESPQSYLFCSRRILRNALQVMFKDLEKTGKVKVKNRDKFYIGMSELKTNDPTYIDFVDALNKIASHYEKLCDASMIFETTKFDTPAPEK